MNKRVDYFFQRTQMRESHELIWYSHFCENTNWLGVCVCAIFYNTTIPSMLITSQGRYKNSLWAGQPGRLWMAERCIIDVMDPSSSIVCHLHKGSAQNSIKRHLKYILGQFVNEIEKQNLFSPGNKTFEKLLRFQHNLGKSTMLS